MQTLSVPRHLLQPGQDGYRTPTIEDIERHVGASRHRFPRNPASGSDAPMFGRAEEQTTNSSGRSEENDVENGRTGLEARMRFMQRIEHFTWSWFTMTMATGGIANVIHNIPFRFHGLYAIGCIFFLLNIILFVFNIVMISSRFIMFPATFRASFLHPTESLFIPAAVISFGTILLNISQYGVDKTGDWLNETVVMTPVWIFPAYPLLIIGPHAAALTSTLPQPQALDILIGGFTIQGIGFMVSLMIYSAFIYRLMTQKLPKEAMRPGMFVSVGPAGFTVSAIVGLAANVERALPEDFMGDGRQSAFVLRIIGNWVGLWLWGLVLWFFFVSVFAHWSCVGRDRFHFAMTWYSFVFPNTALVTATLSIGKAFGSRPIQIIGTVVGANLVGVWVFVFVMMIRAVKLKHILWPQRGEDKDEGGFSREVEMGKRRRGGTI
ncbi:MAG: hypothetical protein M1817_002916 [Caeruleum heppii]|nr:MAG: hypothetical protein M1817_002916 [Caeruleum heppii]